MMTSGQLLPCLGPCQYTPKPQILGRLLDNGDLLVLRFHQGTTVIHGHDKECSCGCGFTYQISGTVVMGTLMINSSS